MEMTEFQKKFIRISCDLHDHVVDFSLEDGIFVDEYGVSKEQAMKEINKLRNKF